MSDDIGGDNLGEAGEMIWNLALHLLPGNDYNMLKAFNQAVAQYLLLSKHLAEGLEIGSSGPQVTAKRTAPLNYLKFRLEP